MSKTVKKRFRHILIQQIKHELYEDANHERLNCYTYRIKTKNNEASRAVIENWQSTSNFDEIAFRHAVREKLEVGVRNVKRIT